MQEDAAVRSFRQRGDSAQEMMPVLRVGTLQVIHRTHLQEDALLPAQAIRKRDTSWNTTNLRICPVHAQHFILQHV